eukprot:6184008-Pleurochrysis_carterae.AAC.1
MATPYPPPLFAHPTFREQGCLRVNQLMQMQSLTSSSSQLLDRSFSRAITLQMRQILHKHMGAHARI